MVYPQPSPEVLRTALAGEILPAINAQEVEGFVAIVHDGELAYIPREGGPGVVRALTRRSARTRQKARRMR